MAADTTYQGGVVQIRQDGNLAVPTGKSIDIESGGELKLAGTAITATAAEINAIAGNGLSAAELGVLDGVTPGTATLSKAVVLDASKGIATITSATITTVVTNAITGSPTVSGVVTATGGVAASGGFSAAPCGMINTNGVPAVAATDGSELTPTTTSVYVGRIFIPCNMTITGVRHFNGSDVTGTVTVALYTSAGVAIGGAVSAATAGSGTDAYQAIPFASPYAAVGPAMYLVGFQYSSASARPNCHLIGNTFNLEQASATIGVTAISPLPSAFVASKLPIASLY